MLSREHRVRRACSDQFNVYCSPSLRVVGGSAPTPMAANIFKTNTNLVQTTLKRVSPNCRYQDKWGVGIVLRTTQLPAPNLLSTQHCEHEHNRTILDIHNADTTTLYFDCGHR